MFVFGILRLDLNCIQDHCTRKLIKVLHIANFLWYFFSLMMALYA